MLKNREKKSRIVIESIFIDTTVTDENSVDVRECAIFGHHVCILVVSFWQERQDAFGRPLERPGLDGPRRAG